MQEHFRALYALQQLDSSVLEIERSASQIPKKIESEEGGLDGLRSQLGAKRAELKQLEQQSETLEGTVAEESRKHHQWKKRLNEIRNFREHQALQRELDQGERQVRDFEDQLLEVAQATEDRRKVIDDLDAELRAKEVAVRGTVLNLREVQSKFRDEAEAARTGRSELAAKVPDRIFKRYETLRGKLGGVAVAVVRDGACSGCNMQIRPQQVVELLRATEWHFCPNCHRFLVHETHLEV